MIEVQTSRKNYEINYEYEATWRIQQNRIDTGHRNVPGGIKPLDLPDVPRQSDKHADTLSSKLPIKHPARIRDKEVHEQLLGTKGILVEFGEEQAPGNSISCSGSTQNRSLI